MTGCCKTEESFLVINYEAFQIPWRLKSLSVLDFYTNVQIQRLLREINKGLAKLGPRLVPVIKIINESERAKGALLDYAGGKMLTKQELVTFILIVLNEMLEADLKNVYLLSNVPPKLKSYESLLFPALKMN